METDLVEAPIEKPEEYAQEQGEGNGKGEETNGQSWSSWQYDFSKKMRLRYAVDIASVNPSYVDNFVKSIRMAPNGCSFLYSTEDGEVHYVDLRNLDFWGCEAAIDENTLPEIITNYASYHHTEVVYGMDW